MADPRILIDRDGERFTVTVEPAGTGDQFANSYLTHKGAASYSKMVGKLRDWPVDDRTQEKADG